jgi:hypothetical protein
VFSGDRREAARVGGWVVVDPAQDDPAQDDPAQDTRTRDIPTQDVVPDDVPARDAAVRPDRTVAERDGPGVSRRRTGCPVPWPGRPGHTLTAGIERRFGFRGAAEQPEGGHAAHQARFRLTQVD